ncbi:MAG TPA: AAA family ATPase [Planctomycetota bacterium]|nr:AAA family ATPase [Planctomycetota bacterium]
MPKNPDPETQNGAEAEGITGISACGYKSLHTDCRIEVHPLTILAGANSSGKSSALQPLLLLKQTLDATYDAGPLRIDGPNVRFTSADQFLSAPLGKPRGNRITVGIAMGRIGELSLVFRSEPGGEPGQGLAIEEMKDTADGEIVTLRPGMTQDDILAVLPPSVRSARETVSKEAGQPLEWAVGRMKCFLEVHLRASAPSETGRGFARWASFSPCWPYEAAVRGAIHVPGLRGNPERTYKRTAVGPTFPGLFQDYVASILYHWQLDHDDRLTQIGRDLERLGLTWKVVAKPVDETQLELRVGRLVRGVQGGAKDLVSIADVGFGVSQALPVVLALVTAMPGQLVYVEQPEIHLHPRAQVQMADLLAAAALRGVKVVAETHSALLLLAIQTLVARRDLPQELVKLLWFKRDDRTGATEVTPGDLDKAGAFGGWPEDFGEVELEAQSRYLDAADRRRAGV